MEDIGCTITLERPHFHLSESLSSVLCLTSEWLLSHHRVWTNRAGMDLIFYEVMELEHILHSDHCTLLEWFSSLTIEELDLTISRDTCLLHEF